MTVPDWYPPAARREVTYWPEAGRIAAVPLGWVLHVTVMNGSPWGVFQGAVSPRRRFSHLWVAKSGAVEQYAPLSSASWAQVAGNGTYWSVETEGYPTEPLTAAQVDALAAIHVFLEADDALASRPGERGIGTHEMGGAAWGNHACPGTLRAVQRSAIIARAAQLRQETLMPTPQEYAAAVWGAQTQAVVPEAQVDVDDRDSVALTLFRALRDLQAEVAALKAAPPGGLAAADVEAAVRNVLRSGVGA